MLESSDEIVAGMPARRRLVAFPAFAKKAGSTDEIARNLAGPGAAMVSVPFHYNHLGEVGPDDDFDNHLLKIQPCPSRGRRPGPIPR